MGFWRDVPILFLSLAVYATVVGKVGAQPPHQHCHMYLSPFYYTKVPGQGSADTYVQIAWDWFIRSTVFSINAMDRPPNHHYDWAVWVGKEEPSAPSAKEHRSHFIFGTHQEFEAELEQRLRGMVEQHHCDSLIVTTMDADDSYATFFATDVVALAEESYAKGLRGGLLGHSNGHASDFVIRGSSGHVYGATDEPGLTCHILDKKNDQPPFSSLGLTYFLASPFPAQLPLASLLGNHMKWHALLLIELRERRYNIEKEISVRTFPRKNVVYWMTPLSGRFLYKELILGGQPPDQGRVQQEISRCFGFTIDQPIVDAMPRPISFRAVCSVNGIKRRKLIERNWKAVTNHRLSSMNRKLPRKGAFGALCPRFLGVVCKPGFIKNNSTFLQLCE